MGPKGARMTDLPLQPHQLMNGREQDAEELVGKRFHAWMIDQAQERFQSRAARATLLGFGRGAG